MVFIRPYTCLVAEVFSRGVAKMNKFVLNFNHKFFSLSCGFFIFILPNLDHTILFIKKYDKKKNKQGV